MHLNYAYNIKTSFLITDSLLRSVVIRHPQKLKKCMKDGILQILLNNGMIVKLIERENRKSRL